MKDSQVKTERLLLRRWRNEDKLPFAQMNADPRVMEFFPSILTRAESDASVGRIEKHFDEHGFGFWAVEIPGESPFIGFVGMIHVPYETAFTPSVEIGWRLAVPFWNKGFATEAARRTLRIGFEELGLSEIVGQTAAGNFRSRRVMEKIGMIRNAEDDFNHPKVPPGHPLERHVLYRIARAT